MPITHEAFIAAVAALALRELEDPAEVAKASAIKLVYGAGQSGLRGVTYYHAWNGQGCKGGCEGHDHTPAPFVEICAFGQESWVQVAGTTIHELGHVLAGWDAGHGKGWKAACARLGLRRVKAAGTAYKLAMFAPRLREAIARLPKPDDGEPVKRLSGLRIGKTKVGIKPCGAGTGTKGGTSRGAGSGSRLRKFTCECAVPVIVRAARDDLRARCEDCGALFKREGAELEAPAVAAAA